MLSAKKPKSIVGLDLEAGSAAAIEVRSNGTPEVLNHGVVPLDPGVFGEGEVTDPEALGETLKRLFSEHKLSRDVRLGVANQRVAVRVLRLPALEGEELESAIRFQAQDMIPMPLDQAVLDWQVVDRGMSAGGHAQVDVVAVAARRDMVAAMLGALRRAGLRPAGIDHSAFGMVRALDGTSTLGAHPSAASAAEPTAVTTGIEAPSLDPMASPGSPAPSLDPMAPASQGTPATESGVAEPASGKLYCNLADATNLAVAQHGACLFTRVSPFGVEAIAQRLAERQGLALQAAQRALIDVGLERDAAELEGEPQRLAAREALEEGVAKLADELRMSLDFYSAQEGAIPVDGVVACGRGTTIPGLVERLQVDVGLPVEIARPAALGGVEQTLAARLTLPYGIALEG